MMNKYTISYTLFLFLLSNGLFPPSSYRLVGIGSAVFFAAYERAKLFTTDSLHLSGPWLGASVYVSAAAAFGVSSILLGEIAR